jgi:very-short-patch-repair endonuclease
MICKICSRIFNSPLSLTIHLSEKHKLKSQEYYDIYLKSDTDGVCKICRGKTNFVSINKGYNNYCSYKCSNSSSNVKEKKIETYRKHYGKDNPSQSDQIKEKKRLTSQEHYHTDNPNQSKEIKEKKRVTCKEKYGVEYPTQLKEIKEKSKQTCFERFGVQYTHQNSSILSKVQNTILQKYGSECIFSIPSFQKRIKNTLIEKYGVDNYSKTKKFRTLARYLIQKRLIESNGKWSVPIGKNEKEIFNNLQKISNFIIFQQYPVIGYFLDGFIADLNLAIEIDEQHHKQKFTKEKDKERQNKIENFLDCIFFRIDEKEWLQNKQLILENFLFLIQQRKTEYELRKTQTDFN